MLDLVFLLWNRLFLDMLFRLCSSFGKGFELLGLRLRLNLWKHSSDRKIEVELLRSLLSRHHQIFEEIRLERIHVGPEKATCRSRLTYVRCDKGEPLRLKV